jgi:catechol 2,3-dioxygenase-like lactoylglutathione lyase family enzyme
MIGYVTLGTNNLPRAVAFYDQLFASLNIPRFMEEPNKWVAWAGSAEQPSLGITLPFDGKPATVGNGTMVALAMQNTAQVQALHALALSLGAQDEGAPGPRGMGFYCAYFRDLDGNKFNAFCHGAAS